MEGEFPGSSTEPGAVSSSSPFPDQPCSPAKASGGIQLQKCLVLKKNMLGVWFC